MGIILKKGVRLAVRLDEAPHLFGDLLVALAGGRNKRRSLGLRTLECLLKDPARGIMAFRRHVNGHLIRDRNRSCLFSRAHPAEQPGAWGLPVPELGRASCWVR